MIKGADISAWQGDVDVAAEARRYGWDFVFAKATEGASSSDSRFSANWARTKAAGLVRGAYHFARPEASSAQQQADRLLFAAADAGPGDMLCLDLEASNLGQAATNAWARQFGARLRERAPHVTTVLYMGSGYASTATGKGLADYFDRWWYPQYPQSGSTTTWPSSFSPWLPSGISTGWARPHIWQWTDAFAGEYDANISNLTIDQLAGSGGHQEEDMPYGGQVHARENVPNGYSIAEFSFPAGAMGAIGLVSDHTFADETIGIEAQPPAVVRVTAHRQGRKGQVLKDPNKDSPTYGTDHITVGSSDGKGWPNKVVLHIDSPKDTDYITVLRVDRENKRPVGVDMS